MNKQIRELLIKAQDLALAEIENDPTIETPYLIPATEVHKGLGLSYEKFAELIVRECVLHLQCRGVEGFNEYEEENLLANFGLEIE